MVIKLKKKGIKIESFNTLSLHSKLFSMSDRTTTIMTAAVSAAVSAGVVWSLMKKTTGATIDNNDGAATTTPYNGPFGEIISGKKIAKSVRSEIKKEVVELVSKNGTRPGLGVIIVGERRDSQTYVKMKQKASTEVGLHSVVIQMKETSTEEEILRQGKLKKKTIFFFLQADYWFDIIDLLCSFFVLF
jgi:hypothetical protein